MTVQGLALLLFFGVSAGLIYNAEELRSNTVALEHRRRALETKPDGYDYDVSQILQSQHFERIAQWGQPGLKPSKLLLVLPSDDQVANRVNHWIGLISSLGLGDSIELLFAVSAPPDNWADFQTIDTRIQTVALSIKEPRRFSRLTGAKILPLAVLASEEGKAIGIMVGQFSEEKATRLLKSGSSKSNRTIVIQSAPEAQFLIGLDESTVERP